MSSNFYDGLVTRELMAKVWARISPPQYPGGCLLWLGATDSNGYPGMRIGKYRVAVHRFIVELKLGRRLTKREVARHICMDHGAKENNKRCCNVMHLIKGSFSDNMKDAFKYNERKLVKQNTALGEARKESKLKEAQVLEIWFDNETTITELSRKFQVSQKAIRKIKGSETWIYLTSRHPNPQNARYKK